MNLGWQQHICVGLKVGGLDEIKGWFLEYLDFKKEQMRRDQQRRMRSINICLGVIHGFKDVPYHQNESDYLQENHMLSSSFRPPCWA